MKIVFFGTSNFALPILEALRKQHEIVAVVTTPDAPAGRNKQLNESPVSALAKDLKLLTFKPERIKGNLEFQHELENLAADIFIVSSYGIILPEEVINLPKFKSLNTHPSALPRYRGASPIQTALLNGDPQTGVSIMVLDSEMDHGPLLAQKIVDIEPADNYFTLEDRLAKISAELLLETLSDYEVGKITPLPQDETHATFTKIITKEDGQVNWSKTAQEIYNQFRAFYIWPGIWTTLKAKKVKLLDVIPIYEQDKSTLTPQSGIGAPYPLGAGVNTYESGTVIEGGKVLCGNGTMLQIRSLQPEGKNEMQIKDFLNGNKDFIGSKLV